MAKRLRTSSSTTSSDSSNKKSKRQVSISTFRKWQSTYEREYQSLSWLRCNLDNDSPDSSLLESLTCSICQKHETNIERLKNFSTAWIIGSTNHRSSNVVDHATSEQHKTAMMLERTERAKATKQSITSYSPIARSLFQIDDGTRDRMRKKFDICYVLAKENVAFRKYPVIHALETKHDVNLGEAYKTKDSAKNFTHYIAEAQRSIFMEQLSANNFYSFLMDGTTDAGRVEDELIVIMYCKKRDDTEEICSCTRFLTIEVPEKADANGLIKSLEKGLKVIGVTDLLDQSQMLNNPGKPILVGGGTDGASVNIGEQRGMKGIMQRNLKWIQWTWCYAHRLELACKDALSSRLFKDIEEMLLRLYYIYEKSPKKSRELIDVCNDLKEVFEFPKGGDLPVRAQGSRWITHKRNALQRVVDRFGAYICHLIALSEDRSVKSQDRAKIKGYISQWSQAKLLIGCALYVDVLKPASLLSLTLQRDNVDIVMGIKNILKSSKSLLQLATQDPLQWPTVKLVCSRLQVVNGNQQYQGAALRGYSTAILDYCKNQVMVDLKKLDEKMRDRLAWSDVELLRSILVFLDTQSWQKSLSDLQEEPVDNSLCQTKSALDYIVTTFRDPLQAKNVDTSSLQDEIEEAVEYARRYLSIDRQTYQHIWYKLHTSPDSSKWQNVLVVCELLFSLPFSNGQVERMFSTLKLVKTDRRTNLNTSTLSDILDISLEGPPLSDFSADRAIDMWWKDCSTTRRVNQSQRKEYQPRCVESSTSSSSSSMDQTESETLTLDDWDTWFSDEI